MNNPVLDGFNTQELTLKKTDGVAEGKAVGLGAYATALIPATGKLFCGICTAIRGDYASVAMKGFARTKYTGTAPSVGYNKLSADGTGYVKVDENGIHVLVTEVNLTDKTIEIIL